MKKPIKYTVEEFAELKEWFETAELPEEIRIGKEIYIPCLEFTLKKLMRRAELALKNRNLVGDIMLLMRIREAIEQQKES